MEDCNQGAKGKEANKRPKSKFPNLSWGLASDPGVPEAGDRPFSYTSRKACTAASRAELDVQKRPRNPQIEHSAADRKIWK